MSVSILQLLFYSGGILLLFLTPGPVWLAIVARTLSGGIIAALPLATGVLVGDIIWPMLAIIGTNWITSNFLEVTTILRYLATTTFLIMGIYIIRNADKPLTHGKTLTQPGAVAGFCSGLAVIIGNPKAILFYVGVLPGFFNLAEVSCLDILSIVAISCLLPFLGNILLSFLVDRVRFFLRSTEALRRTNIFSGVLLILVGLIILKIE
ncbi:MAG: LysE family transporter [Pseudomonadota bacterium]|nr:LysE family transporter [Pseudomonadota bacterium]